MRAEGTQGGDVREIEENWGVKLADKHRERGEKKTVEDLRSQEVKTRWRRFMVC